MFRFEPGITVAEFDWALQPSGSDEKNLRDTICGEVFAVEEANGNHLSESDGDGKVIKQLVGAIVVNALRQDAQASFHVKFDDCHLAELNTVAHLFAVLARGEHPWIAFKPLQPDGKAVGVLFSPQGRMLSIGDQYPTAAQEPESELPAVNAPPLVNELKGRGPNELDHSRPLDVHTWSEHSEVNTFVNSIFDDHFRPKGNVTKRKKHLKVALLDLYLAWTDDPALRIAYHRQSNRYLAKSRYNALHISRMLIEIIDELEDLGLVEQVRGFYDRRENGGSRTSRMWPTDKLLSMFKKAKFGPWAIGPQANEETVIRRKTIAPRIKGKTRKRSVDVEYGDTNETRRMREVLKDYNELIFDTFIDIPALEQNYIELSKDPSGEVKRLYVNQRDKLTRRIFNRNSFKKGGRFWGGWWQRCPKEWRHEIFMDDQATSEIDYSGLHTVMLYALEGIDYWNDIGGDPYEIEMTDFANHPQQLRDICKTLVLVAFNAKSDKETFKAFRSEATNGSFEKGMTDAQLQPILDALRAKHQPIERKFASDAGIDLMYLDAQITERILVNFTNNNTPTLAIHDSFLVPFGMERELEKQMTEAFTAVMGIENVRLKEETHNPWDYEPLERDDSFDHATWEAAIDARTNPLRSARYLHNLEQFREHVRYVPNQIWDPNMQDDGLDKSFYG